MSAQRQKARFPSGDTFCAAWHYPGSNGGCVVMAAGLGIPKEPGTDPLAKRIAEAGFSVLAFDYRRIGESGGHPRQVVYMGEQLDDWDAAIRYARTLPEVDPRRIAIWGFSLAGGHVVNTAARNPDLGAAISHSGGVDPFPVIPYAVKYTTPVAFLKFLAVGLADMIGGALGRPPIMIPMSGEKGEVAGLNTPDSRNTARALDPDGRYGLPDKIAARSALRMAWYRPAWAARRVQVPMLFLAYEDDGVSLARPVIKRAKRIRSAELAVLPGGHYQAFIDGMDLALDVMLPFLRRHLIVSESADAFDTPVSGNQQP
jgi:pimeloyl-ACP methyl ester carboxylesterase